MIIYKRKRKSKVGISFRRIGKVFYSDEKTENVKTLCFNSNPFTPLSLKHYIEKILVDREQRCMRKMPICVVGDAKHPPLPFPIFRYYLVYDPDNFIGEYEMSMYDNNAFLVFMLNCPEDFNRIKEIAHRTVYLGSACRIMLLCVNDAVLPQRIIEKESITDYDIVIMKDTNRYLPYHKLSDSFIYSVPKNI